MTADAKLGGYDFKVLLDSVAEADLFEDKTHENIANSLFKLISSSDSGITVGLEGGWGSGKSTVISLLRERLEKDQQNKSLFFMFDAWAHEGDPLRRIFLESLAKEIDKSGSDSALQEIAKEISGRKKKVEVTSTKRASRLGKILSLTALLIPAGASLLSKFDFKQIFWPWDEQAGYPIFLLWPVLGLLFAPFIALLYWCKWGEKKDGRVVWDIFTTESTEDYTQDVTEDSERTTIEFELFFKKIIHHAISKYAYNKIIVVIDNLDRIEPTQAKSIWSTLQTFFQHRSHRDPQYTSITGKLWFIIPYDRDGFSSIWTDTQKLSPEIAKSFLEKCFQVKAEVPQPVMSGWIGYFKKCANEALTGWPENDKEEVIAAYQHFHSKLDSSPTPRKIRTLINQIGMNGMRWGGLMSPLAICLYSILRSEHSENEVRGFLLNNAVPYNFEGLGERQDVTMEMAGMLFGVSKERGLQLLLGPSIKADLNSGSGDIIKSLIEEHGDAFWITWWAIRGETLPVASHIEEYRISFTTAINSGMHNHLNKIRWESQKLFELWKETVDKWEVDKFNYAKAISSLIELCGESKDCIEWAGNAVKNKLEKVVSSVGGDAFKPKQVTGLRDLLNCLVKYGFENKPLRYAHLNKDNWSIWLNTLEEHGVSFPEVLPGQNAILQIATKALSTVNPLDKTSLDTLSKTAQLFPDVCSQEIINKLADFIVLPQRDQNADALHRLVFEIVAHGKADITSKLREVVAAQPFWDLAALDQYQTSGYLNLLAALCLPRKLQNTSFVRAEVKSYWITEKTDEQLKDIYEIFESANQLSVIWEMACDPKNVVAIQIIRKLSTNSLFALSSGIRFIDEYLWADESEIKELTEKLCSAGSVKSAQKSFSAHPIDYDKCLYILWQFGDENAKALVKEIIDAISTDDWSVYLAVDNTLVKCMDRGNYKYSDALRSIVESSISKKVEDESFWDTFDFLFSKALDTSLILQKITSAFLENTADQLSEKGFSVLSKHIAPFIQKVDPSALMEKLMSWLDAERWDCIIWLSDLDIPSISEPLESLTSRIDDWLKNVASDEHRAILMKIATMFNVPMPQSGESAYSEATDRSSLSVEESEK